MTATATRDVDPAGPTLTARRPGDRLLAVLFAAHLVLVVVLVVPVVSVPPSGDEFYYLDAARALADAVRQILGPSAVDPGALSRSVVSNGWFMPGVSVLLTPLYLVVAHAPLWLVRVYLAVLSTGLYAATLLVVRARLGSRWACAVAVLPGLVPMWVLFSFTAWGDAPAGLVAVVIVAETAAVLRAGRAGRPPRVRDGIRLGVLCAVCLYLRSSSLPLVLATLAILAVGAAILLPRALPRVALAAAAAVAAFGLLLAPWSLAASHAFGTRVTTTTTLPISLGITFGDPDRMCFGPCPGRNVWYDAVSYSRAVAERTGQSPVEVQREMSAYARQQVTPASYAGDVIGDARRYVLDPTAFVGRFEPAVPPGLGGAVVATTRVLYGAGLLALLAGVLAWPRRSADLQVVSILVKALTAAIMVQPFVHQSHGRYWPVFAPLMGLAAGLLIAGRGPRDEDDPPRRLLTGVQVLGTAAWVAVPVAVLALSLT